MLAFAIVSSCDKTPLDRTEDTPDPAHAATITALNPSDFETSDTITLAHAPALARAADDRPIIARAAGRLSPAPPGLVKRRVTEGETIATIAADRVALARTDYELRAAILALAEQSLADLDTPLRVLELEEEIARTQRRRDQLELLSDIAAEGEPVDDLLPGLDVRPSDTLERLDRLLELLNTRLAQARNQNSEEAMTLDLRRTELRRAEIELQDATQASVVAAPTTGIFEPSPELVAIANAWQGEPPVAAGDTLGRVRAEAGVVLDVVMTNSPWLGVDPQHLTATVRGIRLDFDGSHVVEDPRPGRPGQLVYRFRTPKDAPVPTSILRALGSRLDARLEQRLPTQATIIPKLRLALAAPGAPHADWPGVVRVALPGYEVVAEGMTDVAILRSTPAPPTAKPQ